jgi:hypothetical protein
MESREVERLISAIEKIAVKNNSGESKTISSNEKDAAKKTNLLSASMQAAGKSTQIVSDLLSGDIRRSLRGFSGATDGLAKNFGLLGKVLGGFTVVAGIAYQAFDTVTDMTKSFRTLSDVGQTFGGSMFAMAEAAGAANLSMEEFADFMTKNSRVVASIGTKSFSDMGNQVRQNIKEFGMFGLTTSEVNDVVGDYAETLRLMGSLQSFTTSQAANATKDLIQETSALSYLTGKSRKEILKDTNQAMQDSSLAAKMSTMTADAQQNLIKSLQSATAQFAAQPGEVGASLSKMLTQTIAYSEAGGSAMTEFGQSIRGLAPAVFPIMDEFAKKVANGTATIEEQDEFLKQFKEAVPTQTLINLAASGDATAKQFLSMVQQMRVFTEEDRKRTKADLEAAEAKAKDSKAFTDFMLNLEDNYKRVLGGFTEGFMKAFQSFNQGQMSIPWDKIREGALSLGTWFGHLIADTGTLIQWFNNTLNVLQKLGTGIEWIASAFTAISNIVSPLTTKLNELTNGTGALTSLFVGGLTVAVAGAIAKLFSMPKQQTYNVANGTINVANQSGSNSGGFNAPDDKNPKDDGKGPKNNNKTSKLGKIASNLLDFTKNLPGVGLLGKGLGVLSIGSDMFDVAGKVNNLNSDDPNKKTNYGNIVEDSTALVSRLNPLSNTIQTLTDVTNVAKNTAMDAAGLTSGKETTSKMLEYGGKYAGIGATGGLMFGPGGALVGGAVGGAIGAARGVIGANKEEIENAASTAWSWIKKTTNLSTDKSFDNAESNRLNALKEISTSELNKTLNKNKENQTMIEQQSSRFDEQNAMIIAQNQQLIELTQAMVKSTRNLDFNTREQP